MQAVELKTAVAEARRRNPACVDGLVPLSFLFGRAVGAARPVEDLLDPVHGNCLVDLIEVTPGFHAPIRADVGKMLWMPAVDPEGDPREARAARSVVGQPRVWPILLALFAERGFWPSTRLENGVSTCRLVLRSRAHPPATEDEVRLLGPLRGRGRSISEALPELVQRFAEVAGLPYG